MLIPLAILAISSIATVAAVRLLVINGIEIVCSKLKFSAKAKGQIIGYATSMPELVAVVASAIAGVFDAGLWNVASSNIINWVLFISAVVAYRQYRDLLSPLFVDEVVFGVASVLLPLFLLGLGVTQGLTLAAVLLGVFVVYKLLDVLLNTKQPQEEEPDDVQGSLARGVVALVAGIGVILVAGHFLGRSAGTLVTQLNMPAWLVGWILGIITSVPEMASFFEIYRRAKVRKRLDRLDDTQNALDALVASNMCNLGIVLPVGLFVFYLVAGG
jgi:Ca2+/Na+ antiporter